MTPPFSAVAALIPQIAPARLFEVVGALGVLKILIGMWLNWRMNLIRSDLEEAAKDNEISEQTAERRIVFFNWFAPTLTVMGIVLLIVAIIGLWED
jgi:hypothetical protein